jgi:epsilon-lactone hydrolase
MPHLSARAVSRREFAHRSARPIFRLPPGLLTGRLKNLSLLSALWGVTVCPGPVFAQSDANKPAAITVEENGAVRVPAHTVPISALLSPEGQAYVAQHLQDMLHPEKLVQKDGVPPLLEGYLARQRAVFAVEKRDTSVAGVHAYEYTPKEGVSAANRYRVLINLHGGGFSGCWPACAELESMPVSALGRIRVISLDYRQAPKHRFPAASEDVAAVYRELLKTHRPQDIGIYGCSAGGMLTGMAVAWFQRHSLPAPGAVGILCAGMTMASNGFGGDAVYTTAAIGESRAPPAPPRGEAASSSPLEYFKGASLTDPLVAPANSPEVLARFPPTLIVSGTRAFELSSAVHTHALLIKQGVDADLHIWEGMFHGFFYNVDVPESRDCYDVIVKFFNRHLGKR